MSEGNTPFGPIRLNLRTATPEEIRKRNAEEHGGAAYWDEDVDHLVRVIRNATVSGSVRVETLRCWATHPDERVRVAVLKSGITSTEAWRNHSRELAAMMVMGDARDRAENELWTPTLDALATLPGEAWRGVGTVVVRPEKRKNVGKTRYSDIVDLIRRSPLPDWDLTLWVRENIVPELSRQGLLIGQAMHILASVRSREIRNAAVSIVASPDIRFVRWLFQSCPEELPALAARSDLGAKLDGEIWQGVLENLEQRRAWVPAGEIVGTMLRRGAIPETAFGWLLDLVENDPGLISWNMIDTIMTLFWADHLGGTDRSEFFRRLVPLMKEDRTVLFSMVRSSTNVESARVRTSRIRTLARGFAEVDPMALGSIQPGYLKKLKPEDWMPALQATENREGVANRLLEIPSAVQHPEARRFIFEHGSREDVLALLNRGPIRPGEERTAARAVLRTCDRFDEILNKRPRPRPPWRSRI